MFIIGLGYKKRVGKSTSASYLARTYSFKEESFARSLKEGVGHGVFGLTEEEMETSLKEIIHDKWQITPRHILQQAGENLRKTFGEHLWVQTVYNRMISTYNTFNYVISDVRYQNEAEWIKRSNGILVRIDRKHNIKSSDNHQSEIDMDSWNAWDEIIDNNGSLEDLYQQLDLLVHNHLYKK